MQTISRNDLKAMKEEKKQRVMTQVIETIAREFVIPAAERGETHVKIGEAHYKEVVNRCMFLGANLPSLPDIVIPLLRKFPDLDVNYVEDMVEEGRGMYRKVNRIVIDWS